MAISQSNITNSANGLFPLCWKSS